MAVTIGVEELQESAGQANTERQASRVLEYVTLVVTDYAPDAPDPAHNEAAVRLAGYLLQSDFGGIRSENFGPMDYHYVTNHAAMFRASGAMGLLSRWKKRRAGIIGGQPPAGPDPDKGLIRWPGLG